MDRRLAALEVAVLLHDPPWKPWGIGRPPYRLEGCESKEKYWACIARNLGMSKIISDRAKAEAEEASKEYKAYEMKSHELQAALLARILAAELEHRGFDAQASVVREAEELILSDDARIREADELASAIDRLVVPANATADVPVFVNPFNPQLRKPLRRALSASRVAGYIARLSAELGELLGNAQRRALGDPGIIVHALYSLLEPVWYMVFSDDPLAYMPPADTRLPTHTVFDHANAALAALNWTRGGQGFSGCAVMIDLAGIQSWISESRRLRDLWASSWLVSLLAWKSVEEFVDKYGPGILVQPPARLNPLYASWLLGLKLGLRPAGSAMKFFEMLGLNLGWPLDPTVPGTLLLALPGEACSNLEGQIVDKYQAAWSQIMDEVVDWLLSVCEGLDDSARSRACPAALDGEAVEALRRLEAPLGIRVFKAGVREAWSIAASMAGEAGLEDGRGLIYPIIALILLPKERMKSELRLPGRFTGGAYMGYARASHRRGGGRLCSVCGRGLAVIDGRALGSSSPSGGLRGLEEALAEVGGERLCPYCLAKRILRHLLRRGLARKLLGLEPTREADERLGRGTVDYYTTRTHMGYGHLREAVRLLAEAYKSNASGFSEKVLADPEVRGAAFTRNRFLKQRDREELSRHLADDLGFEPGEALSVVEMLESIVLEAAHSRRFAEALLRRLEELGVDSRPFRDRVGAAWSYARRSAILAMDSDNMGRVIRGLLPWEPRWYAEHILNIKEDELKQETVEKYIRVVNTLKNLMKGLPGSLEEGEPIAVPTLSYHFTLSRALAVLAHVDRAVIEAHQGMIVYSGGDDLLAILPPARPSKDGPAHLELTALKAVLMLRRAHWGVEQGGFLVLNLGSSPRVPQPVPAPAAYGRSGVVLYFDPLHPLWTGVSLVQELLEEAKKHAKTYEHSREGARARMEKDVLVHAGESSGASVLPQSFSAASNYGTLAKTAGSVEASMKLAALTISSGGERAPLSGGLPADALHYTGLLASALESGKLREAFLIVEELLSRNLSTAREAVTAIEQVLERRIPALPGEGARGIASRLLEALGDIAGAPGGREGLISHYVVVDDEHATLSLYLAASGLSLRIGGLLAQPLALSLLAGVKVAREAL